MKRFPLLLILLSMGLALALALLFITLRLQPPARDVELLVIFMSASGVVTVGVTYMLYRSGLALWFPSLRWSLWAMVIFTVALVFFNVWVTAQLMFISEHDLVLTVALLVFAGLTALAFGLYIANTLTDRICQLSQAAEQVAQGQLDTRLTAHGNDELAQLAQTFNWMANSLETMDRQKRQFDESRRTLIAGISHDLRTPLTSIRVMLEAISDGVVTDPDTVTQYMGRSLAELRHLSQLIDDLFELARLDAGQLEICFDSASLTDLISDVLSNMRPQASQRQVTLNGTVTPDVDPVHMAPDKIQRVLVNLLDNALRYTPPEGQITIRATREAQHVRVDVHNTGSVIAPTHVPHIFNTFYRGDDSRVRDDDGHRGTGLGLAIARGFVEAHHGRIWVESEQPTGTTFCFTLPLAQTA
ncbi:MAG: HAMP domain-containing histidine kinase [Chloroflexi bacterium]|nr:HAMP domain-containing histidine kinase [Chloroflexota bacterium]